MFLSCQDGHDILDSPMEIKVETTVETETSTLDRYDMNEEPVSEPNFVIFCWSCCVAHPSMHPAEAVVLCPVPVSHSASFVWICGYDLCHTPFL